MTCAVGSTIQKGRMDAWESMLNVSDGQRCAFHRHRTALACVGFTPTLHTQQDEGLRSEYCGSLPSPPRTHTGCQTVTPLFPSTAISCSHSLWVRVRQHIRFRFQGCKTISGTIRTTDVVDALRRQNTTAIIECVRRCFADHTRRCMNGIQGNQTGCRS